MNEKNMLHPSEEENIGGSDHLLEAGGVSIDRLPMLSVVFDRFARQFADRLRQRMPSQAYLSISDIDNERIGTILDAYESNAVVAILYSPELDSRLMFGFDRQFISTAVEVILGADGAESPFTSKRSFTNIEVQICRSLFELAIKAFEDAFRQIAEISLTLERVESRMDFVVVGRRNDSAVSARLLLQAIGRHGDMLVVIPHAALIPVRQRLAQMVAAESTGRDDEWTENFTSKINQTSVTLHAILDEMELNLSQISQFAVGQTLELRANARTPVRLDCRGKPLFLCELGQSHGEYTLKIDRAINQDQGDAYAVSHIQSGD